MTFNLTVNEAATPAATPEEPGTHNVRVHYTPTDAGEVSGPFSLSAAQQFAMVAIGRVGVVKAVIEAVA